MMKYLLAKKNLDILMRKKFMNLICSKDIDF